MKRQNKNILLLQNTDQQSGLYFTLEIDFNIGYYCRSREQFLSEPLIHTEK